MTVIVFPEGQENRMRRMSRQGMTFADILIIMAIVLLLFALALPRFIKAPDFGDEKDEAAAENSNTNAAESASTTNAPTGP